MTASDMKDLLEQALWAFSLNKYHEKVLDPFVDMNFAEGLDLLIFCCSRSDAENGERSFEGQTRERLSTVSEDVNKT